MPAFSQPTELAVDDANLMRQTVFLSLGISTGQTGHNASGARTMGIADGDPKKEMIWAANKHPYKG